MAFCFVLLLLFYPPHILPSEIFADTDQLYRQQEEALAANLGVEIVSSVKAVLRQSDLVSIHIPYRGDTVLSAEVFYLSWEFQTYPVSTRPARGEPFARRCWQISEREL